MGICGAWGFSSTISERYRPTLAFRPIMFVTEKLTYGHWGSDPEVLGKKIVEFIKGTSSNQIISLYNRVEVVDDKAIPSQEVWSQHAKYSSGVKDKSYYELYREIQGNPEIYITDNTLKYFPFPKGTKKSDIEFTYVLNISSELLHVYY